MTVTPSAHPSRGPILLCAGTDAVAAAHLAEAAAALLEPRAVVVMATWRPPPVLGGIDAVMDAFYDTHDDLRDAARQTAMQATGAAGEILEARGMHVTREVRPEDYAPWRMALDLADEIDAGVIVAGTSQGPGQRLGQQARALAHRSQRPLLLLPTDGSVPGDARPAVFATDGSPPATHAIEVATTLLRPRPALVASAWQPLSYAVGLAVLAVPDAVARQGADRIDDEARLRAAGQTGGGALALTVAGWQGETTAIEARHDVGSSIAATAAEHDAAVIVTGTRGRSPLAAALLGSTAEAILRAAGRPVLLVAPVPEADSCSTS
jgi:nucleotide-binding universal stress UspA family protein